jgi:hypothetical protein
MKQVFYLRKYANSKHFFENQCHYVKKNLTNFVKCIHITFYSKISQVIWNSSRYNS